MDPLTGLAIIVGFLSAGFGVTKYFKDKEDNQKQLDLAQDNLSLNEKVASENFDLSKDQFEYQKQLNQQVMDREDNAMQRQIADLKAAGFSPLAATNGASATPLTSANAPQRDISGINTAIGNVLGAYNDIFNRRLNREQFSLQSKVQAAQAYTQLAELRTRMKTANLENAYLSAKWKWEENHGFRDLDWKNELIKAIETSLNVNPSNVGDKVKSFIGNLSENPTPFSTGLFDIPQNNSSSSPSIIKTTVDNFVKNNEAKKTLKQKQKELDSAYITLGLPKDFLNSALTIWSNTNASDYFKDYETFITVLKSKAPWERTKYLQNIRLKTDFNRKFN